MGAVILVEHCAYTKHHKIYFSERYAKKKPTSRANSCTTIKYNKNMCFLPINYSTTFTKCVVCLYYIYVRVCVNSDPAVHFIVFQNVKYNKQYSTNFGEQFLRRRDSPLTFWGKIQMY